MKKKYLIGGGNILSRNLEVIDRIIFQELPQNPIVTILPWTGKNPESQKKYQVLDSKVIFPSPMTIPQTVKSGSFEVRAYNSSGKYDKSSWRWYRSGWYTCKRSL